MLFKTLDRQAWKESIQFALQLEDQSGAAKKAEDMSNFK
jgi:hypothetical protein